MEQSIQRPCPAKAGHVVDAKPLCPTKKEKRKIAILKKRILIRQISFLISTKLKIAVLKKRILKSANKFSKFGKVENHSFEKEDF